MHTGKTIFAQLMDFLPSDLQMVPSFPGRGSAILSRKATWNLCFHRLCTVSGGGVIAPDSFPASPFRAVMHLADQCDPVSAARAGAGAPSRPPDRPGGLGDLAEESGVDEAPTAPLVARQGLAVGATQHHYFGSGIGKGAQKWCHPFREEIMLFFIARSKKRY